MRPPRYPLEPLEKHRGRQLDRAVEGLASAVADRERAEARRAESERTRRTHAERAAAVGAREHASLERGELCAADLARTHAWGLRVEAEQAALRADEARARATEASARAAEHAARRDVAARRADAEVVAEDRGRWEARERKRADAKEEEAMAEAARKR